MIVPSLLLRQLLNVKHSSRQQLGQLPPQRFDHKAAPERFICHRSSETVDDLSVRLTIAYETTRALKGSPCQNSQIQYHNCFYTMKQYLK